MMNMSNAVEKKKQKKTEQLNENVFFFKHVFD